MNTEPMTCIEIVELITEYMELVMPLGDRERFDAHLALCPPCRRYLDQMERTIRATGALAERDFPPAARVALMSAFRHWKSGRMPVTAGGVDT